MSITLPFVDLSSAVVGTSGTIALQPSGLVAVPSDKPPYLQIYNDSGAGLLITLKRSSQQFYLSAKGHSTVAISNAESEIAYTVKNISTNIQVNQLWAVYYYPGEEVSDFSPLGTSSVSQQATTLVNTGNAPFTPIFFAEPAGDNSALGAVQITNAGFLQLGDATYQGDITISGPSGKTTTITNDNISIPQINLPVGSLQRMSAFTATVTTTPTFFNHGLGVVPDIVIPINNGTSATVHSTFVDYATMTTTQVKLTGDTVGGTPNVLLAIKF